MNPTPLITPLAQLVGSSTTASRFADHWPPVWDVFTGSLDRLPELADVASMSFDELVDRGTSTQTFFDYSTPVDKPRARALYREGRTIEVGVGALLSDFKCRLAGELGVPVECVQTTVFATPAGGAPLGAHWDGWEQFIVQLRGRKQWSVARNVDVAHPSAAYKQGFAPTGVLESLAGGPLFMPEPERVIEVQPGSVIFLPRGTWHDVRPLGEESWHVSIYIRTPTLCDILSKLLVTLPEATWRVPVRGYWQAAGDRRRALAQLLAEVARVPARIDAAHARAALAPYDAYYWGDHAPRIDATGSTLIVDGPDNQRLEVELSSTQERAVAGWLAVRRGFRLEDLLLADLSGETDLRLAFVETLCETGVLFRCADDEEEQGHVGAAADR